MSLIKKMTNFKDFDLTKSKTSNVLGGELGLKKLKKHRDFNQQKKNIMTHIHVS